MCVCVFTTVLVFAWKMPPNVKKFTRFIERSFIDFLMWCCTLKTYESEEDSVSYTDLNVLSEPYGNIPTRSSTETILKIIQISGQEIVCSATSESVTSEDTKSIHDPNVKAVSISDSKHLPSLDQEVVQYLTMDIWKPDNYGNDDNNDDDGNVKNPKIRGCMFGDRTGNINEENIEEIELGEEIHSGRCHDTHKVSLCVSQI
ncbi:uncharacterized protein LOC106884429 [Octopus bimaculoides]|uniref:Uncharacterized protein n=1 Tax=Octopus bimaculoides TaxID=37653 RepID=A0A0L8I2X9_OCTBM|nr:uncharacterized protein LOC106884429 [Octopus bimaculoides]|eukprot:XP_014791301.1 PREDICTED: uncharacterized protein LOC106884429 [Octopus bimaculoides]